MLPIEAALPRTSIGRIWLRRRIERFPSALGVRAAQVAGPQRRPVEHASSRDASASLHARGHERAATAYAFRIHMGVVVAHTGLNQRTDNAAGDAAGGCACGRCDKPAGCDNRADAGNCQQA